MLLFINVLDIALNTRRRNNIMQFSDKIQHVFMIGAKSMGTYGGYETFVYKLTEAFKDDKRIKFHVACKSNGDGAMNEKKMKDIVYLDDNRYELNNAICFKIHVPQIGAAQALYYDIVALKRTCEYIKKYNIKNPIIYIMACRIGPFIKHYYKRIKKYGGKVYLNPDGHEWLRSKWSKPVKFYWKQSERIMVKYNDLVVCDSVNIEKYIHNNYDKKKKKINTKYIAYGTDLRLSRLNDDDSNLLKWYSKYNIEIGNYYLVVGRFVPENSYEIILREFMKSKTEKKLVVITNTNKKLLHDLERKLNFRADKRIEFVGTVYKKELLMKIRENAYAYIHGHTVGGTNPSLIEALGSTKINLLRDVVFNKEVAADSAFYWNEKDGNLSDLIDRVETIDENTINEKSLKAKKIINERYTWDYIAKQYEKILLG